MVILRYNRAAQLASGGTVTTYTSGSVFWVHSYLASGTFTA